MTKFLRVALGLITGVLATVQSLMLAAQAEPMPGPPSGQSQTLSMSAFISRVRQDPALRARFLQDPRGILREHGIDPTRFNVPERINEAQLERLLNDWSRAAGATDPAKPPPQPDGPRPAPAPVYGPPPGLPPAGGPSPSPTPPVMPPRTPQRQP